MFVDVIQNTEEWFNLRLKKATSSHFGEIMANEGKAFGEPAKKYAQRVALEYVTGERDERSGFRNSYMDDGIELEPIAINLYEIETFNSVKNGGFNIQDSKHSILLGDSPDGNVGESGCIEVKSVIPNTQWARLKRGGIDNSYKWQIHGHIWIGKKEWCDFISYCPEMPEEKRLYICRVYKDEDIIERMESRMNDFKELVLSDIKILQNE